MKKLIYKILFTVFAVVFLVSVWYLFSILVLEPHENKKISNEVRDYYSPETEKTTGSNGFDKISEQNSDIVGWIKIPGTAIDYPVVQPPADNELFYLTRDFYKKPSAYGTIFVDLRSKISEQDSRNIVLHGHSMRNGSMFGDVLKFTDEIFCKSHKTIIFNTLKENAKWEVFAVFRVNSSAENPNPFNYFVSKFPNNIQFMKFVEEIKSHSIFNLDIKIEENDKILMLSTCSYEGGKLDDYRTVVAARKL